MKSGYGQYDGLIAIVTPALGAEGLELLKQRIETIAATPVPVPPKGEWEAVGYGSGGTTYAHQMEERSRQSMVGMALKDIADAMGDVDAFIAQYDPKTQKVPKIAAEIAARLLVTGRAEDALGFIERAEVDNDRWVPREWQDTRLEVLEALDRNDEAQASRYSCGHEPPDANAVEPRLCGGPRGLGTSGGTYRCVSGGFHRYGPREQGCSEPRPRHV